MAKISVALSLLGRCASLADLKQLHAHLILTYQLYHHTFLTNKLLDLYLSQDLSHALTLFSHLPHHTLYMYNSILKGLTLHNRQSDALLLYRQMDRLGYSPNHFTFPFVLRACAKLRAWDYGCCVHGRVVRCGFVVDAYASVGLLYMYASCGGLVGAGKVFDEMPVRDVVAWSTLIAGYVNNGMGSEAVRVFEKMEKARVRPNEVTMVSVLMSCGEGRDLCMGKRVHSRIRDLGIDPFPLGHRLDWKPNVVLATALLDMYGKCGSLEVARLLFDSMPVRNVVSWNSMIGAYSRYGQAREAIRVFIKMCREGVKPDRVSIFSILCACGQIGKEDIGQAIHAFVEKTDLNSDVCIKTSLLDMYVKVGEMDIMLQIFGNMEVKDLTSWTSVILGLAMHGHSVDALLFFDEMQRQNVIPDHVTYVGVLCACSHAGLVEEGRQYFYSMRNVHGIEPTIEHYGCMIDLLSRSGHLLEAQKLMKSMPIKPNAVVWGALLNGCEIHGNVRLAERIRNTITQLHPQGSGLYVLMSNIFAKAGKWLRVEMARELMRQRKVVKSYGHSFVDLKFRI